MRKETLITNIQPIDQLIEKLEVDFKDNLSIFTLSDANPMINDEEWKSLLMENSENPVNSTQYILINVCISNKDSSLFLKENILKLKHFLVDTFSKRKAKKLMIGIIYKGSEEDIFILCMQSATFSGNKPYIVDNFIIERNNLFSVITDEIISQILKAQDLTELAEVKIQLISFDSEPTSSYLIPEQLKWLESFFYEKIEQQILLSESTQSNNLNNQDPINLPKKKSKKRKQQQDLAQPEIDRNKEVTIIQSIPKFPYSSQRNKRKIENDNTQNAHSSKKAKKSQKINELPFSNLERDFQEIANIKIINDAETALNEEELLKVLHEEKNLIIYLYSLDESHDSNKFEIIADRIGQLLFNISKKEEEKIESNFKIAILLSKLDKKNQNQSTAAAILFNINFHTEEKKVTYYIIRKKKQFTNIEETNSILIERNGKYNLSLQEIDTVIPKDLSNFPRLIQKILESFLKENLQDQEITNKIHKIIVEHAKQITIDFPIKHVEDFFTSADELSIIKLNNNNPYISTEILLKPVISEENNRNFIKYLITGNLHSQTFTRKLEENANRLKNFLLEIFNRKLQIEEIRIGFFFTKNNTDIFILLLNAKFLLEDNQINSFIVRDANHFKIASKNVISILIQEKSPLKINTQEISFDKKKESAKNLQLESLKHFFSTGKVSPSLSSEDAVNAKAEVEVEIENENEETEFSSLTF